MIARLLCAIGLHAWSVWMPAILRRHVADQRREYSGQSRECERCGRRVTRFV